MRPAYLFALVVPLPLAAQPADDKKATIQFLVVLQQPDGGFVAAPGDAKAKSSLRATSAAVRAIKYLGGESPNVDKARAFVTACHDPESGAFADTPGGKSDVTLTAVGIMAAVALEKSPNFDKSVAYMAKAAESFEQKRMAVAGMEAAGKFDPVVKTWFGEIREHKNVDGTYGIEEVRARQTGSVIAMYLRAGEKLPDDERKTVIAVLQAGQRPDGGFGTAKGSDGETTYRVMRAFHLLKEQPKDVAKLKEFIATCRNADGGYGTAPGQPSTASGTYYAAAVMKWLGE